VEYAGRYYCDLLQFQGALCANDDETKALRKFSLEGIGECLVVMPNITTGLTAAAAGAAAEGRKPSVVPAPAAANPELSGRPRRRTFTAAEKLRILQEADGAAAAGAIGALLRREGLYSSALTEWRRQREAGVLGGLTPARRGPKPRDINPLAETLRVSQLDCARLRLRLERAEAIIELQKKLSDLLGIPPASIETGSSV
jgi:transposase-like protein